MLKTLDKSGGIKSIQRGFGTIVSTPYERTVLISPVDIFKSVVLLEGGGVSTSNPSGVYLSMFSRNAFKITTSTSASGGANFSWQVIEYY